MRAEHLIVLKLGGSVLLDETTLRQAVHEIYRWRRRGWGVVAVASALAGRTDRLLAESRGICDSPAPDAVAPLVSQGELHSTALLGLHLDRAGLPACVLSPAAVGLVAEGDPLDATPVRVQDSRIRGALQRGEVVVLPGYLACDPEGRSVLLGRGGSDLTALFLAQRLGASRCRLIKDVDGLYERDPSLSGPRPRRYARMSYEDALRTDGSIVQHKALRFARSVGLGFEVGRLNATRPTSVERGPSRYSDGADRPRPLRVALLGLGTVGSGVFELLRGLPQHFELVSVAVRRLCRPRAVALPAGLLTEDALGAVRAGADVVVEVMGGLEPARAAVEAALAGGAHVVTANKSLLAVRGSSLAARARAHGRLLCASASVGGSMPLLERIAIHPPPAVRGVRGVLNGTTNYVLERMGSGVSLGSALREAQRRGYAELDSSRDLSGEDAADKLCVIAQQLGRKRLGASDVRREALSEATLDRVAANGSVVRHLASLELGSERPAARVALSRLDRGDPLATVAGVYNAAVIELRDGTRELVRGKGAGRWPTAEAVLADLLEIARRAPERVDAMVW